MEAESILAGIVLDTKGFTMRTGSRTFETAAFLRKAGADISQVNKCFQHNLRDTVTKFQIIQGAQPYHGTMAITLTDRLVGRAIAGQAADEMLNIAGIEASFVLFPEAGQAYLSARSSGNVNVQVICETLGGGGNAATAGAQFPGKTPEEVLPLLKGASTPTSTMERRITPQSASALLPKERYYNWRYPHESTRHRRGRFHRRPALPRAVETRRHRCRNRQFFLWQFG